jgi:plastocyanin
MTLRRQVLDDPIHGQRRTVADNQVVSIRPRRILAALVGLLALALSACGTSGASTAPATEDGGSTVTIQNMSFTPQALMVKAGGTVTWVWRDGAIAHDVKGDGFKSKVVAEGTFRHRFDQPGTYKYLCTLHPNMTGTIEVTR